jgi:hypothetical protein
MTPKLPDSHRSRRQSAIGLTPEAGAMFTDSHSEPEHSNDRVTPRTVIETLVDYLDSLVGVEVFLSIVRRYRELSTGEPETREGA